MLAAVALIAEVTVGTTGIQSVVMLPVGVPMVGPAFHDEGGFVQVLLKETVTFTSYEFVPGGLYLC
jgi:hypothetical protein